MSITSRAIVALDLTRRTGLPLDDPATTHTPDDPTDPGAGAKIYIRQRFQRCQEGYGLAGRGRPVSRLRR